MSSALPIVSAVIPVLSERKNTGTGGGSAVTSARSPSSLTGHHLRRAAHPFVEPALIVSALIGSALVDQCLRLYQPLDWYYPQPVGSSGETGHITLPTAIGYPLAHQSSSSSTGQLLITRLGSSPRSSARWQ